MNSFEKLKNVLKSLLRIGEEIPIEEKLFSIILFFLNIVMVLFISSGFFLTPELQGKIWPIQCFALCIFIFLFYKVNYQKIYKPTYSNLFLVITFFIVDFICFFADGISGATILELVLLSFVGMFFQRSNFGRNIFLTLMPLNFITLFAIGKLFPDLVLPYKDNFEKESDFFGTGIVIIFLSALLTKFFKSTFDADRDLILKNSELLKNINLDLEESKTKAEKLSLIKSQFLSNMSHEIRTPLNGIIGMTELFQLSKTESDRNIAIETIQASSKFLLAIVNDILDYSKIEDGQFALEEIDISLGKIINEVFMSFSRNPKLVSGELKLDLEMPLEFSDHFLGDELRLKQILINLIGNAIKFTDKGSVRIRVSIVEDSKIDSKILIQIIDTGPGIEDLSKLFKLFSQADNSITRKFGGTGLGLVIAKKLIEMMNGVIQVSSELHKGSNFYFTIQLKKSNSEKSKLITDSKPSKLILKTSQIHPRILLVEDNEINQIVFEKFISKIGLQCKIVNNGIKAIEEVKSNSYDLIFMDMNMPEMDGITATIEIRKLDLKIQPKIVSLTANVLEESKQKCLEAGMNDFLTKPYSLNAIRMIIEKNFSFERI